MRLVIIESPYAGDTAANTTYARACVRDSLLRGEAPIASHLLYTQPGILDDSIPSERQHGIDAGLAWRAVAQATVVYTDRGISPGMAYGIKAAKASGIPVEYRSIEVEKAISNQHAADSMKALSEWRERQRIGAILQNEMALELMKFQPSDTRLERIEKLQQEIRG